MKNIVVVGLIVLGLYYFYPQDHSSSSVAEGIEFDGYTITYNEESFVTEWSASQNIKGYVRSIESIKMNSMPIITTAIAITTGDYSDPEKTRFEYIRDGYTIYQLNHQQKIKGTVTIYNLIPNNQYVQSGLNSIQAGSTVSLNAKLSTTGRLKGEVAELRFTAYTRNEYVSAKMTRSESGRTEQYIAFVESI